MLSEPEYTEPNYQSYPVHLTKEAPITRNELMQRLLDQGIATRRGIMLAHTEPAYGPHVSTVRFRFRSTSDLDLAAIVSANDTRNAGPVIAALFSERTYQLRRTSEKDTTLNHATWQRRRS